MHLHWDGDNDSVDERNLSAALGAGVTPVTVDHAALKRVRDWIWTLPPPAYPYAIDRALAARGAPLYQQHCVELPCRQPLPRRREGRRARRPGRADRRRSAPIATGSIRTPPTFAANQYALYPDSPYRFTHFRKTNGYANQPLDGIWLRGPYPAQRLGADAARSARAAGRAAGGVLPRLRRVRSANGRLRLDVPRADGQRSSRGSTRPCRATATAGHVYGTTLSDDDKRAIVEYLKTF